MNDWLQPDYLLSAMALLVAAVAVWVSRSAMYHAARAAEAAEDATEASRASARAAHESAQLALEFLDVHSAHWVESMSALLCIESIRRNTPSSPSADRPVSPGFAFGLHNRGNASARTIAMGLMIDGTAQDWHPTLPDLDPGAKRQVRFPFSDRMYLPHEEFTITLDYHDTQIHRAVFVLKKAPGALTAPRLVAARLDGGDHPGHPIDDPQEHISTRVHPSIERRTAFTRSGPSTGKDSVGPVARPGRNIHEGDDAGGPLA